MCHYHHQHTVFSTHTEWCVYYTVMLPCIQPTTMCHFCWAMWIPARYQNIVLSLVSETEWKSKEILAIWLQQLVNSEKKGKTLTWQSIISKFHFKQSVENAIGHEKSHQNIVEPNLKHHILSCSLSISYIRIIHPKKYYRNYLAHSIRPDGREFDAFRPIRINIKSVGTADGSAIVKLGSTTVVCGIKAVILNNALSCNWKSCDYRRFPF